MSGRGYFDPYGVPLKAPCPACAGRVPMKHQASRLVCPRCRGELLDRHDASALLSRFKLPPLPESDPARQHALTCGLCGGQMTSHRVPSGQTVELCGNCAAMFVEAAQARLLHQSSPPAPAPASAAAHAPVRDPSSERPDRAASTSSGLGGPLRLLARLSPVLLLLAAGWHFRDDGRRAFEAFRFGPSSYSTMADMGAVRPLLAAEVAADRWPADLPAFLRDRLGSPTAHLDRWGTPYELRGDLRQPVFASCGPDQQCGNDDDLLVPLFRAQTSAGAGTEHAVDRLIRD